MWFLGACWVYLQQFWCIDIKKKDENKVDEYEMKTVNEDDNVNARMTCSSNT